MEKREEIGRLSSCQEIAMQRLHSNKTSRRKVEITTIGNSLLQVGSYTQKTGKTQQEKNVEIGKALVSLVQPSQRILKKGENGSIVTLLTQGTSEKLGKIESNYLR